MLAQELREGDEFTVNPPDDDHPTRICISNVPSPSGPPIIKWGWPGNSIFWSFIGFRCPVQLIARKATEPNLFEQYRQRQAYEAGIEAAAKIAESCYDSRCSLQTGKEIAAHIRRSLLTKYNGPITETTS
jgi:hypothetical protein